MFEDENIISDPDDIEFELPINKQYPTLSKYKLPTTLEKDTDKEEIECVLRGNRKIV